MEKASSLPDATSASAMKDTSKFEYSKETFDQHKPKQDIPTRALLKSGAFVNDTVGNSSSRGTTLEAQAVKAGTAKRPRSLDPFDETAASRATSHLEQTKLEGRKKQVSSGFTKQLRRPEGVLAHVYERHHDEEECITRSKCMHTVSPSSGHKLDEIKTRSRANIPVTRPAM